MGRFFPALKSPFKLNYEDLVKQIKVCLGAVAELANAGARTEIRDIRTIQGLHHAQFMDLYSKLLAKHNWMEKSLKDILQVTTSSKAITQEVRVDDRAIKQTTSRLEYRHVVQFFAPTVSPHATLLKAQSFVRRNPTLSLRSSEDVKMQRALHTWALSGRSSFLVVHMSLGAQKQGRELAAEVIHGLNTKNQSVF